MVIIEREPVGLKAEILSRELCAVSHLLPAPLVEEWCRAMGYHWRDRVWGPAVTLMACAYQQMAGGVGSRSVEHWLALQTRQVLGGLRDGKDFCQARIRLPLELFLRAVTHVGGKASRKSGMMLEGMPVWFVDGSTSQVPRSQENVAYFGRARNGCGLGSLPVMRYLLRVCAGSGAVLEAVLGTYHHSEMKLFRRMLASLPGGGLMVMDRGFSSYLAIWRVKERGSYVLCRHHQTREGARVKWLGYKDALVLWERPRRVRPGWRDWLPRAPRTMEVRVIEREIRRRGYRTWTLRICTTLLNPKKYPAWRLVALYLERWNIELDLRSQKGEYALGRLASQSPQTVKKEFAVGLLAYNMVRAVMAETGESPRDLSLHEASKLIITVCEKMSEASAQRRIELYAVLLREIRLARIKEQDRPSEPRAVVIRSSEFPRLKLPRSQWRAKQLKKKTA